jgi:ligand-binding SRPBCC domain-containing protein
MTQRFETSQWVPFPVELVFAFFTNPTNLPYLMPLSLRTRIEDARIQAPPPRPLAADPARRFKSVAAGVGSEILISFYPIPWVPRRVSWLAAITEFQWNSHFTDAQLRDGQQGTLVTDAIEYELPFGVLGRLGAAFVRRHLKRSFAYRQKRLPEILAAAARQAALRG